MAEWADVVAAATRFPGVTEATSYGTPSLKVRDKFLCRLRTNPDALVIRVIDVGDQEALLLGDPDVFFKTPHYDNLPYVLVRLDAVSPRATGRARRGRLAHTGAEAADRRPRRR